MQTLTIILTSVTAVGAIWAALASTRQAHASSVQARLAERSLAEQIRSVREQDERARLTLEVDILYKLEDRFKSPSFMVQRRRAANYVKEHYFTEDGGLGEVMQLNRSAFQVLNFFEALGHFVKLNALKAETVQNTYGSLVRGYWTLYQTSIQQGRIATGNHELYENFEKLSDQLTELAQQREGADVRITKVDLRSLVEGESVVGEDTQE